MDPISRDSRTVKLVNARLIATWYGAYTIVQYAGGKTCDDSHLESPARPWASRCPLYQHMQPARHPVVLIRSLPGSDTTLPCMSFRPSTCAPTHRAGHFTCVSTPHISTCSRIRIETTCTS